MVLQELTAFYSIYLSSGIGSKRLLAMYDYFGSAEIAFRASSSQLQNVPGLGKTLAKDFVESRQKAKDSAEKQLDNLPENVRVITYYDNEYPDQLKSIYQPPAILFVTGNTALLRAQRNLAIIGTRKMTDYGKRTTKDLCKEFAKHSIVITSGFASGIDTCAHEAIFDAGGETIAVLGSGINVLYPAGNKTLAKKIDRIGTRRNYFRITP